MARKAVPLTLDHLPRLPAAATTCLRWKLDAVARHRVARGTEDVAVRDWFTHVSDEWGACGRALLWDDDLVGFALYAPPAWLPGLAELPTAPPSPEAVVLAEMWVAPRARGAGAGRMLVQSVARDLVTREVAVLEAFGHSGTQNGHSGTRNRDDECRLPADFLGAVGFTTHRAHSTTPRMRMDLGAARTWKSEVELALDRLVGAVRPGLKPSAADSVARRLRSGPRAP